MRVPNPAAGKMATMRGMVFRVLCNCRIGGTKGQKCITKKALEGANGAAVGDVKLLV
jgi:hypothetical protein